MQTYVMYDVFNPDQVVKSIRLPDNVVPTWWVNPFNPPKARRSKTRTQVSAKIIDFTSYALKRSQGSGALPLRPLDAF
jgi:hypothetical protein